MAHRSNAIEFMHRVHVVYGWYASGYSRTDVVKAAIEKWGVHERQVDNYTKRARELIMKDAELERPAWIAEALTRAKNYEKQAAKKGQYQTAINSLQTQAKLIGINL